MVFIRHRPDCSIDFLNGWKAAGGVVQQYPHLGDIKLCLDRQNRSAELSAYASNCVMRVETELSSAATLSFSIYLYSSPTFQVKHLI